MKANTTVGIKKYDTFGPSSDLDQARHTMKYSQDPNTDFTLPEDPLENHGYEV